MYVIVLLLLEDIHRLPHFGISSGPLSDRYFRYIRVRSVLVLARVHDLRYRRRYVMLYIGLHLALAIPDLVGGAKYLVVRRVYIRAIARPMMRRMLRDRPGITIRLVCLVDSRHPLTDPVHKFQHFFILPLFTRRPSDASFSLFLSVTKHPFTPSRTKCRQLPGTQSPALRPQHQFLSIYWKDTKLFACTR